MTVFTLTLISLILTVALIATLISFITVITLNKKLIKAKNKVDNYNNMLEASICKNISHEFDAPVTTILSLIDKINSALGTRIENSISLDIELLSRQSENLKLLIDGVSSIGNLKDYTDNSNTVFGNLISYYQYLFEVYSELAEIKKVDYMFKSNIRVLNINYNPEFLRSIISNIVGSALKYCSQGDSVKIEIILNKNLKNYKIEITSSHFQPLEIESDLAILATKQLVRRLNGSFEIKHSQGDETIYFIKLPISKELNNQPMGCLTIHKPIKSGVNYEYINESETENNKKTVLDPDFLNRVTSLIYREITNTENIIETISSELCISSSQLNRRIKLMTGLTTTNFILKTRLNRAKKQLTVTQKPIGEIAMECGFNDFAYFSRSFKKEFDMTPTTFQRLPHSLN